MIAQDLVSVQPMDNRVGEIRYVKYQYASDKGNVNAGDKITSARNFGGGNPNYSSETVENEALGEMDTSTDEQKTATLSWTPVRPGTIKITSDEGTLEVTDDGDGGLTGDGISDGEIDYESGEVKLTMDESGSGDEMVYVDYRADFETAPVDAPQVSLKIETLPIVAKTRKLSTLYASPLAA